MKIEDLKEYHKNPRKMVEDRMNKLVSSLKKLGDLGGIVVNLNTNEVIGGNQRVKTFMQEREKYTIEIVKTVEVPMSDGTVSFGFVIKDKGSLNEQRFSYREVRWDERQAEEANIVANKITGAWDFDILANQFDMIDLKDWGFLDTELGDISLSKDSASGMGDPDDVPEVMGTPETKKGDIWQLGDHRIMCGDATSKEDMTALMGEKIASMVFTDPPYNVDYTGGMGGDGEKHKRKKILNDKMTSEKFYMFLFNVMTNLMAFTKGGFYVCMSSSELHNLYKAFTDAGGHWQTYVVWAKNSFTLSRSDYQHKFEPVMYGFSYDVDTLDQDKVDSLPILYGWNKHSWYGGRKQGDVWNFDRPTKSDLHPTMKPVALVEKAIKNSSLEKEIVLDTFLGSGTTVIAAERLNRVCYGMELDPHYFEVCIKRWEDFTGKKAVKV